MFRVAVLLYVSGVCHIALAAEPSERELEQAWTSAVAPFVQTYCSGCHGKEKREGKLDMTAFSSLSQVAAGHATWETVRERLEAKEMPPEEAKKQPTAAKTAPAAAKAKELIKAMPTHRAATASVYREMCRSTAMETPTTRLVSTTPSKPISALRELSR